MQKIQHFTFFKHECFTMKTLFLVLLLGILQIFPLFAQPWQAFTPVAGGDYQWSNVSVVNEDIVWFTELTGSITHTDDGGTSWVTHALGDWDPYYADFYMNPLAASSASHAYIEAGRGLEVQILETKDGGASWSKAFVNGGFAEQINVLWGMHFFNENEGLGLAISNDEDAQFYTLHTMDGGLTWDSTFVESLGGFDFLAAFDVAGDTLWVSTFNGVFLQSTDRGLSWAPVSLPGSGIATAFALTNGHEGIVAVIEGDLYYTSDGGQNWEQKTAPAPDALYVGVKGRSGAFIAYNTYTGWAEIALDTCQNWGLDVKPSRYSGLNGMRFLNPHTGWAASDGNVVFKWSDQAVILDTEDPVYTALKTKQVGLQNFGAKLALWTAAPDTYEIDYKVLRNNVLAYQNTNAVYLAPGITVPSIASYLPTGPGAYSYVTSVLKNNLLLQSDTFFQYIGDSLIAQGVGIGNQFRYENNRGNLIRLTQQDTLSSIHLQLFVNEAVPTIPNYTCDIEFWVFGQDTLTGLFTKEYFRSTPIPIPLDTNNLVTVGGVRAIFVDLLYQLSDTLVLPAGRYAIGSLGSGAPFSPYGALDTRTIYEQAVWNGSEPELVAGWDYAPAIEANFNFKKVGPLATTAALDKGLRVLPNPAQDYLSFDVAQTLPGLLGSQDQLNLRLFNLMGQELLSKSLNIGMQTCSVAHLPTGTYIWCVTGENGRSITGRVVVK